VITIPKKGDLLECSNHRTISLMNHMSKILMIILLERLKSLTRLMNNITDVRN